MDHGIKIIFVWISLLAGTLSVKAQAVNEQIWNEYMLNYPFANSFNLENAFTYSTLVGTPKWRALDYSATVEWSISQHIDLLGQTVFSYTNQNETDNTFEVRPIIGTRLYFTPNSRVQTRLLIRTEQRNFQNLETKEWTQVTRPRIRAEVIVPINKKSYYDNKMWYAMADTEWLFNVEDVEERFANRFRGRIGAGYRLSNTWRFEFLYMIQLSKNTIDDPIYTSDNIFRFRVKQFLRKSKESTSSGVGN